MLVVSQRFMSGVAEMFCTSSLNEEYAKLKDHKGFIRMAIAHQLPVVPVYIFGSSHLFQRLHLPAVVEKLSRCGGLLARDCPDLSLVGCCKPA
jgi:hypothetical protein